jgi:hypothetical protein
MFNAPTDWESYYDKIVSKCEAYISTGYWEEIDKYRLHGWLSNFSSCQELYFSSCLLDALVFRSRKMVDASFRHIASSTIPKFLLSNGYELDDDLDGWCKNLQSGKNLPFRFVAIENVDDKSGKSGSIVARTIKESLDLAGHLTPTLENIGKAPASVTTVVFIDDFTGTGEQFCDYYERKVLGNLKSNQKVLYVPLAAHESAIARINDAYPRVTVIPVEMLTSEDSFFHPIDGFFRGDKINSVKDAIDFYMQLCKKNGFENDNFLLGKGEQSLSFAFWFSTPNNNLKLLYHKKPGSKWKNLLNRNR